MIDVVEHPVKHLILTITAVIAILFCFIAYVGAENYALVGVTIVSLAAMIFYVRKDREDFERKIYREIHHWKIDTEEDKS